MKYSWKYPRIDVDDWPKELNVGDKVQYKFKIWTIVKKMSNEWHSDKPTFILKRLGNTIEV